MSVKPLHIPKAKWYMHFNFIQRWCPHTSPEVRFFNEQAFSLCFLGCMCTLTPHSQESNCWSRWCPSKKSNSPTMSWISMAMWVSLWVGKGKEITRELLAWATGLNGRETAMGKGCHGPHVTPLLASPSYHSGGQCCVKLECVWFNMFKGPFGFLCCWGIANFKSQDFKKYFIG